MNKAQKLLIIGCVMVTSASLTLVGYYRGRLRISDEFLKEVFKIRNELHEKCKELKQEVA